MHTLQGNSLVNTPNSNFVTWGNTGVTTDSITYSLSDVLNTNTN